MIQRCRDGTNPVIWIESSTRFFSPILHSRETIWLVSAHLLHQGREGPCVLGGMFDTRSINTY